MDLFFLSHPWDFLASYPPTITHSPTSVCCTPMALPSERAQSLDPTVWTCLSHPLVQEHTTIPFIACLSVPFFPHMKGERAGERVTEKWKGVTKTKKKIQGNNYMPLLSMNPVLAVSQLQNLWTNLEACKVPHYSSRGGVFQEQLAWMATEHREGFVWGFWPRTSFAG